MDISTLLIDCEDQKGLVYKITGVIYNHGLNILSNDEYVDRENNKFFMRTEISGEFSPEYLHKSLKSILDDKVNIRIAPKKKKEIVVLVTKEHHCIGDLLIKSSFGDMNANIKAVISNYDDLRPLVEKFGIPYHFVSHKDKEREVHEKEICDVIDSYSPEYIVLAKYMRVLTPFFVGKYPNQIVNIHHSFLPAFIGANPYKQAFERGVKIIGATAHFVNNDLDEGPIITQNVINVDHSYTAFDMMKAGHDVEKIVLANALDLVFEDRVFVDKNKTIIFE